MYGIPVIYGLILRYFSGYRKIFHKKTSGSHAPSHAGNYIFILSDALNNAIEQIVLLGGCMILFNCLRILPLLLEKSMISSSRNAAYNYFGIGILNSLMEIGGGLSYFVSHPQALGMMHHPLFISTVLSLLTFGGISCLFQTYLILRKTNLSIVIYLKHKLLQSVLIFFVTYYMQRFQF